MVDISLLITAINFAFEKHGTTPDKSGFLYVSHVMRVMAMMVDYGLDHMVVGVLHDVLEETDATAADLMNIGMPKFIIDSVVAITKRKDEPYANYMHRVKSNFIAFDVKLYADIVDNTSEYRMKKLPPSMQKRLRTKYEIARAILLKDDDEGS